MSWCLRSMLSASQITRLSSSAARAVDNVVGIVADGSPVPNGGLDHDGNAYSATLLGTSLSWAGSTFTLGPQGRPMP